MIDLHCHVLPGIDDGPTTIEGSVALARAAALDGTNVLLATPHVNHRYPNDPDAIAQGVRRMNERLTQEGIEIEVRVGAELAMTRLVELEPSQVARYGLGGSGWLLVECPLTSIAAGFDILVLDLKHRGHRVLLAHPERSPTFRREPHKLQRLVQEGALTSITSGALTGRFGSEVRSFALRLIRDGLVHNVASDAHDHVQRPPTLRADLVLAGLEPLADWLTRAVPAAILTDQEIPPRPVVSPPVTERRPRRWHLPGR